MTDQRLEKCLSSAAMLGGGFGAFITEALGLSVGVYVVTLAVLAAYQFGRFMWVTR